MREQTHYVPILKARLGEYNALKNMASEVGDSYTPLIEFVPNGDETNEDGYVSTPGVLNSLKASADRLSKYWPTSRDLIVDTHAIPGTDQVVPMAWVVHHFGCEGNQVIPAVRPSDSAEEIGELAGVLRTFGMNQICIRLAGEDLEERDESIDVTIDKLMNNLRVSPASVDIVVDFGPLHDEQSASFAARIARLVIMDLPRLESWRSVTLAAGGFPSALGEIPPEVMSEIPRWELTMWRSVRDRLSRSGQRVPSFGDYAIAYPAQVNGVSFAPAPQIRYAAIDNWLVLKGRKTNRRANGQFLDICGEIAAHPEFTSGLSWGDVQIENKARFADMDPIPHEAKPGNAMIWRAIGTSHHLSHVIARLATAGEP